MFSSTTKAMRPTDAAGFSLVELAVVVFIVGILLVSGIKLLQSRADSAVDAVMEAKLTVIREALVRFISANKYLPCPNVAVTSPAGGPGALPFTAAAAPDGNENRSIVNDPTSVCAGYFGVVPYQTLGLSRDAALDGWGNFFSYHVSLPIKWTAKPATGQVFPSGLTGSITVKDRTGAAGVPDILVTDKAVLVVVSHGKNGLGAFSANGPRGALPAVGSDEYENTDANTTYVRRDRTDDSGTAGGAFDDYVMYMSKDDLLGPLYKDGTMKSPEAKLNEDFQVISDAVFAQIGQKTASTSDCGNNVAPVAASTMTALGIPIANQYDPWGTLYAIAAPVATVDVSNPGNAVPIVTITSNGPDTLTGTAPTAIDDRVLTLTAAGVRARWLALFTRPGMTSC